MIDLGTWLVGFAMKRHGHDFDIADRHRLPNVHFADVGEA
jgi:hypothetical protein